MNPKELDFFQHYLRYQEGGECPVTFHRWSAIAGFGAWLGDSCWIQFGDKRIYPNVYVMLVGEPGTRKSTAIKAMKRLLKAANYTSFAPEKTTKEKFLIDLAQGDDPLWESSESEVFIAADEFHDFFGNNLLDFASLLGVLWDYEGDYESKVKNGDTVVVREPRVSVLGGNTAVMFNRAFPPEVAGQGFLSRLILIHADETGKKVTFPPIKSEEQKAYMVSLLQERKFCLTGNCKLSPEVKALIDKIYTTWEGIEDPRFAFYANRRLEHLLKLVLIHTAARLSPVIETQDVIYANTVLHKAEQNMQYALGNFGLSRNAAIIHKILSMLDKRTSPMPFEELWSALHTDLDRVDQLGDILKSLSQANKIQTLVEGILIKKTVIVENNTATLNFDLLTRAERSS